MSVVSGNILLFDYLIYTHIDKKNSYIIIPLLKYGKNLIRVYKHIIVTYNYMRFFRKSVYVPHNLSLYKTDK